MLEYLKARVAILRDREDGQAMVEYALILGLVSVVAIATLQLIGQDVTAILQAVEAALKTAVPAG
jgi:Flp pilus assembly pilin Flp